MLTACVTCMGCGQDNESDHDDEGPRREEGEDSYICTLTEPQTAEQQYSDENSDENSEEDYEQPCAEDVVKPPRPQRVAQLQEGHHRGNRKSCAQRNAIVQYHCCYLFYML